MRSRLREDTLPPPCISYVEESPTDARRRSSSLPAGLADGLGPKRCPTPEGDAPHHPGSPTPAMARDSADAETIRFPERRRKGLFGQDPAGEWVDVYFIKDAG